MTSLSSCGVLFSFSLLVANMNAGAQGGVNTDAYSNTNWVYTMDIVISFILVSRPFGIRKDSPEP